MKRLAEQVLQPTKPRLDRPLIRLNREHVNSVRNWIEEADYQESRSQYGCPPRLLHLLNRPIDDGPTYTDLLVDAAQRVGRPVNYLEIGVSVGKNFLVLAKVLDDCQLVGFDWERINPNLAEHFEPISASRKVRHYQAGSNRVSYVQGDVFCREAWRELAGHRFNLIFSDAQHRREAVLREFEMIQELDLIDESAFFLLWDDLDADPQGPMSGAFFEIADKMKDRYSLGDDQVALFEVNGWLGQHEHPHLVGVISNIGFCQTF